LSKNRCTLKSKNPLVAGENHVVRQQSTAKKTGSSFRRYASRLFVLGTGSLIKSGIQQMVIPKRLDSVIPLSLSLNLLKTAEQAKVFSETKNFATTNSVFRE
jgi:hypothetical protein